MWDYSWDLRARLCFFAWPLWAGFDAGLSLLEESRFTGDTLHTVVASTLLTAEVAAPTQALILVLNVVTLRTLRHACVVWLTQAQSQHFKKKRTSIHEIIWATVHLFFLPSKKCGLLQLKQWSLPGPLQPWQCLWHCWHFPFWSLYELGEHSLYHTQCPVASFCLPSAQVRQDVGSEPEQVTHELGQSGEIWSH